MDDMASVGLKVDSRDVRKASGDLDRFAAEGKKTEKAAGGVTKSAAAMSAGMHRASIAIGAAVAGLAALSGSIQVLSSFERQMSAVGAVSRATADEMAAMRSIAAELGSTTEFTATQAGEGLEFLARAGFSASESVSAIPAVLDLATAAAMGLGNAADISSNIMSAFGIAATDAASVADVLAAASSRANTDVEQLGTAMSFVGPVASALEIEMSDAAAAIGVLSDAGIQGSSAGTGLRRVLSSLANPTGEAKTALEGLGLELERLNPQTNDITEIVQRLSNAGLSAADALTIFGDRGGPAILALTSQTGRLRELTGALTDVEGESARMADTMRDNLGGDIDSLWSSVQGLIIALGDAGVTAVLRGVIGIVTGLVRGITALVGAFQAVTGAVGGFARGLLGIQSAEEIRANAIDNVTLAMGDQIRATQELNRVLQSGLPTNLDMVEAKLEEARARRFNVEQLVAERQEMELAALGYFNLVEQIGNVTDQLNAMAPAGSESQDLPIRMREQYEQTEQTLVAMLTRQQEMLQGVREGNQLRDDEQEHLNEIESNIRLLRERMAELNGETSDGVDLTGRLSILANGVDFSSAVAGASALAERLGVSLGLAKAIAVLTSSSNISSPDEVFDPRSPNYNADIQASANRQAELDKIRKSFEDQNAAAAALAAEMDAITAASGAAADELDAMASEIERLEFDADPVKKYNAEMSDLNDLLDAGLSQGAYDQAVQKLNDELADQTPMVNDLASAWSDFIVGGLQDFKGFVSSVWDSFKNLLSSMIATAARNRIMISLDVASGGAGPAAAGGAPGGIGGMGGGGGLLGGAGSMLGGLGSAAIGGFMNAGGALLGAGGGIGSMVGSIGAQIGAATTGSLTAIAGAIGAVAAPLLAVAAVFSFFKKKTKELDSGLKVTVDGLDTLVQTFRKIETSRFWGLSKSVSTRFKDASDEVANPLIKAIGEMQGGIVDSAAALGIAGSTFDDFTHTLKVSTKGLSDEAAQEAVMEAFERMGDAFAGMVPGLQALQKDGEGAMAAISRLAQSLTAVNGWMGNFRLSLYDVSLAGGGAAAAFVDLFGSLENFNAVSQSYYANFFTDAERIARATELLSIEMQALGIDTLPATRAAFRALVDEADALGDSGLVASLMQLSPAFAEITAGADALGDSLRALVNEDMFATGQDYARALSRSSNSQTFTPQQSDAELRAELRALNVSMERLVSTSEITAGNTGRGADAADDTLAFQLEQTL